jgi:agmatinase
MAADTPRGPVDATVIPRYGGPATFARLPRLDEVERADVAVVGVPFDSGVSYRPGARFGPAHIRASSKLLRTYPEHLFGWRPGGRTRPGSRIDGA